MDQEPRARYRFLKERQNEHRPASEACRILDISRSGFYEYLGRRKSNAQIEHEVLASFITDIFAEHKDRYGTMRISHEFAEKGIQRAWLNMLIIGDITCIPTHKGFLFLAAVTCAFSRKMAGWPMDTTACENLVIDALEQAMEHENPDPGLIFHNGQGTQYTSRAFQKALSRHRIIQSVSQPGNPYDNAVAKSFFKILKRELVKDRGSKDQEETRQEIFKYSDLYCNPRRMHSSLGYRSPVEYKLATHAKPLEIVKFG